jgi:hypothetical protein
MLYAAFYMSLILVPVLAVCKYAANMKDKE